MPGSIPATADIALSNQTRFLLLRVDILVTEGQGNNQTQVIRAPRKTPGDVNSPKGEVREASLEMARKALGQAHHMKIRGQALQRQ